MEKEQQERALLVGVNLNQGENFRQSMNELEALAQACDMIVVGRVEQNLQTINKGLYIGTGKVLEVKELAATLDADVVIFDNALSPMQLRNLQNEIEVTVLDRTSLILAIFETRAKTHEAKMQVEIAKLQYMLPRLAGLYTSLGRQGGGGAGVSNKGSGEKKIDLDKRRIEHRIDELKKELDEVAKERDTQRKMRMQSQLPLVALVGYTNAGKSTMLNMFLDEFVKDDAKKVLEKNMLFATLDTTVRKIIPKDTKSFLLSDTVGFIHKLPHNLVKAFRSTLEEAKNADLILQIVDVSDEHYKEHIKVTESTLQELGAESIPMIYVYNKADLVLETIPVVQENTIYMSAKQKIGMGELLQLIEKTVYSQYVDCEMLLPYDRGNLVSYFNESATVKSTEYKEDGVLLSLHCKSGDFDKYQEFVKKE